MRRGRDARGRAGRQAAWLRVTAAASSATLLGTLGLAGTSMAATGAAAKAAKPAAATAGTSSCHLGNGVKHVVDARVRQRALLPGQPERPVRPGADAEPAELLHQQRHVPVQQPHAAHRAHRRRHPDHADRPVRRPARHADLQQLPGLQRRRPNGTFNTTDPAGSFAYWTDPVFDTKNPPSAGHDTNPNMVYSPVPPATAAHPVAPDTVTPAPVGAVHPGRLRRRRGGHGQPGAGEHRGRHPQGVRRRVAGRPAAERRHGLVQGRRDRGLRRRRRALRPGQRVLRRRQGR